MELPDPLAVVQPVVSSNSTTLILILKIYLFIVSICLLVNLSQSGSVLVWLVLPSSVLPPRS